MKIAVRAIVLAMLVTGFAADHMLASKAAPATPATTMTATASALPMPGCRPGSGSCGLGLQ
ncbi:MAG: hypothetical protein ABI164_11595 [Acidobacteriaceae bacterium]